MVRAQLICESGPSFKFLAVLVTVLQWRSVFTLTSDCHGIKTNTPCQFPYRYKGRLYYECTTEGPGVFPGSLQNRCPTRIHNFTNEASINADDWEQCSNSCPLQKYNSNQIIEQRLQKLAQEFPGLVKFIVIGKSHRGQNMSGVVMSANVEFERETLKPKVRYIGNMHGNEPVGREMLLHLAEAMAHGYGTQEEYTELLDKTEVTLIPTINPDGFDRATEGECLGADYETGRFNEGDQDLNRDFPTWREIEKNFTTLLEGRQPETQAVMKFIDESGPYVLSANIHGGAVVASYPWDDYRDSGRYQEIHKTPDHDIFSHLALVYASNHLTMQDNTKCTRWNFKDGITNGAQWYELIGGLQDYNYVFTNDFEITLEISCCKYPIRQKLNQLWERNRDSLVAYINQVHKGVKGHVWQLPNQLAKQSERSVEQAVGGATIFVEDVRNGTYLSRDKTVTTNARGEFWRMLLPGTYRVRAEYDNCLENFQYIRSDWIEVTITDSRPLVIEDLYLTTVDSCSDPR